MTGCFKWLSSQGFNWSAKNGRSRPFPRKGFIRACIVSLGFCLAASIFFHPAEATGKISSGWKSINADDLAVTAASIGYPDADAAILLREGDLDDNMTEGTSLKIYVRMKVFNERGLRYADVQLPYRVDLGKIADVHARTVRADGKVVEVEKKDIFDKLLITNGRNVWRAKTFSMPSVEPGSIIEYRYRQVYPAGFRYFALDLQSDLFIKQLQYRFKPERSSTLDVRWVSFNSDDPSDFTPKWNGAYNIKAENIPPFRREPLMPPELAVKVWGWLYYSKDTDTDPDKYWREYGQHMYDESMLDTRPTSSVRAVVDAITAGAASTDERVRRIYDYVQKQIRSIDDSQAKADHLKHNADSDQTIRRRYGTASEKNMLFVSMLRAAGLDARVAELTTRDENLFHRSFADAFQFNSELTAVARSDGRFDFFDPGSGYCPAGTLSWEKEGVPALVYDKDKPAFVVTPVTPADQNAEDRVIKVTPLSDGRAEVRTEAQLSGLKAADLRAASAGLNGDEQTNSVASQLKTSLPGAVMSSPISVAGVEDQRQPIRLSYAFAAATFAPPTETRLLLKPELFCGDSGTMLTSDTRINKVYFRYPWSEKDVVTIEIPPGFAPEQLPDDVQVDIGAASYKSTYRRQANSVIYERDLVVNGITFDVDQYSILKSFFDRVHQADQAVLSLKR